MKQILSFLIFLPFFLSASPLPEPTPCKVIATVVKIHQKYDSSTELAKEQGIRPIYLDGTLVEIQKVLSIEPNCTNLKKNKRLLLLIDKNYKIGDSIIGKYTISGGEYNLLEQLVDTSIASKRDWLD